MSQAVVLSRGGRSLELALAAWLDAKAHKSDSSRTAGAYRTTMAAFREALRRAGLDLDSETRAVALAAQAWAFRRADGVGTVAGSTANQRLAIVSSFYAFGILRGLLDDADGTALANPIGRVERARVQAYAGARALSAEQVAEGLGAIERRTLAGKRDYALLSLALATGRRSAELRALRCGDLLTIGEAVTVTWRRTKGGKVMQDALGEGTAAALSAWLRAFYGAAQLGTLPRDAPVFVALSRNGAGTALSHQALADIMRRHLGTSKIHTTRHTFARQMEDAGAKVSEIQRRLGHASIATTGRYLAELASAENPYVATLEQRFGVA